MTQSTNIHQRVAIMVDGDNVSPAHAAWILQEGERLGPMVLVRAYGDMSGNSGWHDAVGFHAMHSGKGKSATDILIAIDAVEFALTGVFDTIVLVSSKVEFTHLAERLRGYGMQFVGIGAANAPSALRDACCRFDELPARSY